MSETIQDLKLKSAIPAQVAKDAQTGNEKKKIYRLLLGTFIATWLLVGLVYAIFVKKTSPVHIHIHNPL